MLSTLVSMNSDAPRDIEPLIGEAVDFIVHIARTDKSRVVTEILEVYGFEPSEAAYTTNRGADVCAA